MVTYSVDKGLPLSLDWLALTLRLKTRVAGCPAGCRWAYYSSTNVWSSRWCLFNEYGDKLFTLLFQPRSQSVIKADRALFEVANEWLYHGIGFHGLLDLLRQCCDFDVLGVSRFDLAADFCPDGFKGEVIRSLANGSCYVSGKRSGSGFWEVVNDNRLSPMWQGKIPHCQSWGHKTSDVRWKLYYKSKELREGIKGGGWNKPYIVDMWREVGLDETNVWRLEVSVHNANTFDFMGDKLTYERFCNAGTDLFKALYTSRFTVRRSEGHRDKSNDSVVEFLPVGQLRDAFRVRTREVLVEHHGALTLLRHLLQDVMTEQVLLNDTIRESCIDTIEVLLERNRMHEYFRVVTGDSFDSWKEWVRVQAYYYGEEHMRESSDSGEVMERALLEAGVVNGHWEKINPLAATSSVSHGRSSDQQLRLEGY